MEFFFSMACINVTSNTWILIAVWYHFRSSRVSCAIHLLFPLSLSRAHFHVSTHSTAVTPSNSFRLIFNVRTHTAKMPLENIRVAVLVAVIIFKENRWAATTATAAVLLVRIFYFINLNLFSVNISFPMHNVEVFLFCLKYFSGFPLQRGINACWHCSNHVNIFKYESVRTKNACWTKQIIAIY